MRNLLKYDFKYTWRIWWIAAVAAVAATFLGCISIRRSICYPEISESPLTKSVQGVLDGLSVSGIIVYVLALALFMFLIELVVLLLVIAFAILLIKKNMIKMVMS